MKKKNQTSKNNEQIKTSKHEEIFKLIKNENNKIIIAIGNYRVSRKQFDTFEQAENYIATKPYELIFNCSVLFTIQTLKDNETKDKDPQDK